MNAMVFAKIGALSIAIGLLVGCRDKASFPVEPVLKFKSFEIFGDSASLIVSFTDGDGDVGLDPTDNQPPFDTASYYNKNFFVEHSELINGEWQAVVFTLPLYYRIPRITPTGQNKVLEGDIALAIDPFPLFTTGNSDTVRYSVNMVDRALHVSNTVVSNDIIIQ